MNRKTKGPSWFKLWLHHKPLFEAVPDDVAGRVIKAVLNYFDTGEVEPLAQLEMVVFSAIKSDADDAHADYQKDVENGKKGGRPRLNSEEKPPVRVGNPPLPPLTEGEGEREGDGEDNICSSAVHLLNELSGSSFRPKTKATQRLISAREKEGYCLADVELVIRHQCSQWGKDEKMRKYLRPETLFGSKFEAYLSDARRSTPKQENGYTLAPLEDPWEAAVKEGQYV